ncbi:hypothetical protein EOD42_16195 [Rhodovarius crocodyli]|uniref:DUF3616 domain-containing protein n=1 Tax=Rhodovarius crocodyli TaxID=1979269 RepID=A0A437MDK6_9PROT|nr:hypothetical protein [Rhodovarius crocodyli]RVT95732.1 hypothetical protein EOD42_16195 [Rhodovarius crocodyli]
MAMPSFILLLLLALLPVAAPAAPPDRAAQLLALTPRPATVAARPDRETLAEQLRIERAMQRAWPRGQARLRPPLEEACIVPVLRNCQVDGFGSLASEDGTIRLLWQRQRGFTPRDGTRAGIVVLRPRGIGWEPLTWAFDGSSYGAPVLLRDGEAHLLHIPGRSGGTGRGSVDMLYAGDGRAPWREVELVSWQDTLAARLPAGLTPWQGASFDPAAMRALVPLGRADDAMCCPRGGQARVGLRVEGNRLAVASVALETAAAACPAERARYRAGDIEADLLRAGPGTPAESDLLLRLRLPNAERWFRFAQAQGYGTITILPVEPPGPATAEDGIQDMPIEADLVAQLHLLPIAADLTILTEAPHSGRPAPAHLLLPGFGRVMHYGLLPGLGEQRGFPTAFWSLDGCRAE